MPTEAKRETVADLREALSQHQTYIVSSYRGLTVSEITIIRRSLRKHNVSYRVVKNRLARIAAAEIGAEALVPLLTGPTALALGDDAAATARVFLDATRPYSRTIAVRGAVIGGRSGVDTEGVTRLATLPSREVLLAQLAGALQSPLATLGGLFGANLRNLGYALSQVRDRRAAA